MPETTSTSSRNHAGGVDWPSVHLAASIAIVVPGFIHVGMWLLSLFLPWPVFNNVAVTTRSITIAVFDYGLIFASACLIVRFLGIAKPLHRAPVSFWVLVAANVALVALIALRLWAATSADRDFRQVMGVLFWAYQGLITIPGYLAILIVWIRVLVGFLLQLRREGIAYAWPSPAELALAFFFGFGVPAAALAPLFPGAEKFHERFAKQEARHAALCKDAKAEFLAAATPPKSVFFDPSAENEYWNVTKGIYGASSGGVGLAESLPGVGPLDYAEYWQDHYKRPDELKRCDSKRNCSVVTEVTAKYRVRSADIQSKADEALAIRVHTITIDERESGRVIARLRYVLNWETHRICAPGKEGKNFADRDFIAQALGIKARFTELDLARNGAIARAERELKEAAFVLSRTDSPTGSNMEQAEVFNHRCWSRAIMNQDLDLALKDCNRAIALVNDAAVLDSRALVYYRMGRYREAIADCDRAIDPRLVGSLYLRGLAKRKSGDAQGGDRDIAAAKKQDAGIAEQYAVYGVAP